ncbi:phosphotransferase [Serinicoccus chungangensis]|uniref:phosphotransferase n=1 Tax=Serinicoccus chungangensis TaxID=767452 RepID=UPI00111A696C|nr:phosphotransferase [Serinicoccus chungangensis]
MPQGPSGDRPPGGQTRPQGVLAHTRGAVARGRRGWQASRTRRAAWRADPHVVALDLVRQVERVASDLPRRLLPRTFVAQGRALLPAPAPELVRSLLPASPAPPNGVERVASPVSADAVVLAKFALLGGVKLRAAYASPRLTLAVDGTGDLARLGRIRASHRVVGASDPDLIPPLVAHGVLPDGACWLVEGWVDGAPLATGVSLATAAAELLERLRQVHVGHGVEQLRLVDWWDVPRRARWQETVRTGIVPPLVDEAVGGLLDAGGTVTTSWCHGDLVASNVLRAPEGLVLVDWERAGVAPVMLDAARLHLFSADPGQTLVDVRARWAWPLSPGELGHAQQLALAHAFQLSAYALRRAGLEGHPRSAVYERQARRSVDRLVQVLDLPG